jgi:hypothetical protein
MNREEIENKLQEVFTNILQGDGQNYPIRIVLLDNTVFNGFRIIENSQTYILGLTEEQRKSQVKDTSFFLSTIILKNKIKELDCPKLWGQTEN